MSDWLMALADPLYLIVDLALGRPLAALLLTSAIAAAATFAARG
jgi:hypothetical protein